MVKSPIRMVDGGVEVDVLVVPNASRAGVIGLHGDRVKVRVTSPPERNKANAAVVEVLKEVTGARRIKITRGGTGRHKTVVLAGVSLESVKSALAAET